jgi:hypothetical protein
MVLQLRPQLIAGFEKSEMPAVMRLLVAMLIAASQFCPAQSSEVLIAEKAIQKAAPQIIEKVLTPLIERGLVNRKLAVQQLARRAEREEINGNHANAQDLRLYIDKLQADPISRLSSEGAIYSKAIPDLFHKISSDQWHIFKMITDVPTHVRLVTLGSLDLRDFLNAFSRGARDPERYFHDVPDDDMLVRWKNASKDKRIFIAGAEEDTPLARQFRSRFEQDGYVVYFYQFCQSPLWGLCPAETVGAFFATSGTAVMMDTPWAKASRYVFHEVATAQRLQNGDRMLYVFSPADLSYLGLGGTLGTAAGTIVYNPMAIVYDATGE